MWVVSMVWLRQQVAPFCRLDIASAKAVMWSDCKMGRSNESGMLFGATVNAER